MPIPFPRDSGHSPFCAIKSGPFLLPDIPGSFWYPADIPSRAAWHLSELCYYGNGRDVNNPTCLDNQVGREVGPGVAALPPPPLPPQPCHFEEELKGHQELLQLIFIRRIILPADAIKEA